MRETAMTIMRINTLFQKKENEKMPNLKIPEVYKDIIEQYPELSSFLKIMPVSIPDEKKTKILLQKLGTYYNSLDSIMNKYGT